MDLAGAAIVMEIPYPVKEMIQKIRNQYDPRLADNIPPEITIAGSSGIGVIAPGQDEEKVMEELEKIAVQIRPFTVEFGRVVHFPNSTVYVFEVLPQDQFDHFQWILKESEIEFEKSYFPFFPHCSIHIWGEIFSEVEEEMLQMVIPGKFKLENFALYQLVGEKSAALVRRFNLD